MLRKTLLAWLILAAIGTADAQTGRQLVVVSIDGLDHRYLRDRDKLGLKIPNIRKLIAEGQWAAGGVVGVLPSETFPSHTTMVTGVLPAVHGILQNNNPKTGERNWFATQILVPTLWDLARAAGLKTASVDWPVTVNAPIDFNFPEKFNPKTGAGDMTLADHEPVTTPGLIAKIAAKYPSFATLRVDDRSRTLAAMYAVVEGKANLTLLHLSDHDHAAHSFGPFSRESIAAVEFADECIGRIIDAMPKSAVFALVSDHGFERIDKFVSLKGVGGGVTEFHEVLAIAENDEAAGKLRASGLVGHHVPQEELKRYAPQWAGKAVFESPEHVLFGDETKKPPAGTHGFWPRRSDYHSVFVLWGNGVKRDTLPEIEMTSIAGRFAEVLGLKLPSR